MNIVNLIKKTTKPGIYTKGTAVMWQDAYIADHLLDTHLNQELDLASRKESTIELTIDWILDKASGSPLNVLDLGCGPGLYTEKLAEKGHNVTGIDFSKKSIRYAIASAAKKGLDINYFEQNYLELEADGLFDLVMMIFTDFGVLLPEERKALTEKVFKVLKPGGVFIFDVLNENYPVNEPGTKSWEVVEKGFWRDRPYLALTESFYYEAEKVSLSQHVITDETGSVDVYRFWIHSFSHKALKNELAESDFKAIDCYENIIPDSLMCRSGDVTFCVAKK